MGDYSHVCIIVMSEVLDIVHCPSLNIHNVSQAGFGSIFKWNRLWGEPTHVGLSAPLDFFCPAIETASFQQICLSRFFHFTIPPEAGGRSSVQKVGFYLG
jgi:hypothetical protein